MIRWNVNLWYLELQEMYILLRFAVNLLATAQKAMKETADIIASTSYVTSPFFANFELFILLKVYQLAETDPRVFQKALLSSELKDIFAHYAVTSSIMVM